jgi:outer membrane receptor protein involved in Fe transport
MLGRFLLWSLFAYSTILSAIASQPPSPMAISGFVSDPSGAAVAGATITLRMGTTSTAPAISDQHGQFRVERVAPGRYQIEVKAGDAFTTLRQSVTIDASTPPLQLTLSLSAIEESVDVTANEVRPSLDTAANLDTTTLSGNALDQLPVFDQNLIGALSSFLDPSALSTGGVTIVVDGVEMKSAGVPRSAIQEIAINSDPYSAESSRPGRGRIEIMTKPGSGDFRGSVNFAFRNSSLATRSYFAPSKPPERRHAVEGVFGGPLGSDGKTSFLTSFSQQNDAASAIVHAVTPSGPFDQNVTTPSTNTEIMARVTHDWNERHRASLQVNWKRFENLEQGAGGFVLPEAAVNSKSSEQDVFLNVRSLLSPVKMNQFQLTLEFDHEPTVSISSLPGLIVRDAFTAGGAQGTLRKTESGGKLNDIVTLTRGKHVLRFGLQIPNLNRRVFDDQTNQGGTFSFANLADYEAGRPYAYVVQQGAGHVSFWWREYGGFVQDQIKVTSNLQASLGLRYDWQSYFHDTNNFSPRASLAWSPRKDGRTVVRTGAGIFYDRSGVSPIAALLLHNGQTLRSYTILNPSYPDPFAGGQSVASSPVNITELAQNVQIPYSFQYGTSIEQQLTKAASIVIGYRGSHGYHMFRSVNVNAPLAPDYTTTPDPRYGQIQEIRSDASQRSDALELTLRARRGKRMSGQVQYTFSRTRNDSSGIFWYPADQYAPVSNEWGSADYDQRHRLNALLTVSLGRWIDIGLSARLASALPYTLTAGEDLFHTGLSNARPAGAGRNTLRGSGYSSVDARWSHDIALPGSNEDHQKALTVGLDAFNIFNHPNFSGYVGNVRSPFYRSATVVAPGRRLQLSAELKF